MCASLEKNISSLKWNIIVIKYFSYLSQIVPLSLVLQLKTILHWGHLLPRSSLFIYYLGIEELVVLFLI